MRDKKLKGYCFLVLILLPFNIYALDSIDVSEINRKIKVRGYDWEAEENFLTELTPAERKGYLGGKLNPPELLEEPDLKKIRTPGSFDWRDKDGINWMTSVKDQSSCGSCWAFSIVGAFEALVNIRENKETIDLNLSEQMLVSNCCDAGDCGGGYTLQGLNYMKNNGIPEESCYSYQASNSSCDPCPTWESQARKPSGTTGLQTDSTDIGIIKQIVLDRPVSCLMKVYSDLYSYSGGVYRHTSGGYEGMHAVIITGWDDSDSCWIVKNSWGSNWGENGYFRIRYMDSQIGLQCCYPEYDPLQVDAGADRIIGGGDTLSFNPDVSGGSPNYSQDPPSYSYHWSPEGNIVDPYLKNAEAFPETTSIYELTVNDLNRSMKDSLTVEVLHCSIPDPAGDSGFLIDSTCKIDWHSDDLSGDIVLDLMLNNSFQAVIDTISHADRPYWWVIPDVLDPFPSYRIRISPANEPAVKFLSAEFSILKKPDIIFPENGHLLAAGIDTVIEWTPSCYGDTVGIHLKIGTGSTSTHILDSTALDDGRWSWNPVDSSFAGDTCRIEIKNRSFPEVTGESEGLFYIILDTMPPDSVKLVQPGYNETLYDSTVTLVWKKLSDIPSGIKHYTLSYSETSDFSGAIDTSLKDTFSGLKLGDGNYYWRVRATDRANNTGIWSESRSFTVDPKLRVYPGDTDNDGSVTVLDVLPLGQFWKKTGPPRDSVTTAWQFQYASVWEEAKMATYADCNGDGIIDIEDVLAIGQNWGETLPVANKGKKTSTEPEDSLIEKYIDNYREIYNSINGNSEPAIRMKNYLKGLLDKFPSSTYYLSVANFLNYNSEVKINFYIPERRRIRLSVYDNTGRIIEELIDGEIDGGTHSLNWDYGKVQRRKIGAGIYFIRLKSTDFTETEKVVILK